MNKKHTRWIKIMTAVVLMGGFVFAGQANAVEVPFRYSGDNGPGYWSDLNVDWGTCSGSASNAQQSPVNIDSVEKDADLKRLELVTYPTHINIFNNGHTIEQEYEFTGSSIVFADVEYELLQFHFHTLSEHLFNGKRGTMELHAVFKEFISGKILVVGMLYKIDSKKNSFIQTLIDAGLPAKKGDVTQTRTSIDLADALTSTKYYYTYAGSLTTPPCSEVVTWVMLKKVAKLSKKQWASFRGIMGNNFRPLQSINGRTVHATDN